MREEYKKNVKKGSPEWNMFMDFWNLFQSYWCIEDSNCYWEDVINDVSEFAEKHKNVLYANNKYSFSEQIGNDFLLALECENRRRKGGISNGKC